jgi:hypothetical protein
MSTCTCPDGTGGEHTYGEEIEHRMIRLVFLRLMLHSSLENVVRVSIKSLLLNLMQMK